MTDQDEWVERLKGADREVALEELRTLIVRGLSRTMTNRGGGEAFAEDVAQEALLKILDALDSFEGRSKFTTWAMTIATRLAISELRRRYMQDTSLDSMTEGGALQIPQEMSQRSNAERKEVLATLQNLIDQSLSDKQRIAMEALLGGMPVEEIARRTKSNRNAVYKLIHDARKRLREGLEQAGFAAEDMNNALA